MTDQLMGEKIQTESAFSLQQQKWNEVYAQMMEVTDALGKHIEPGIIDAVVALNVLGIATYQSCEGEVDSGLMAPWVAIKLPNTNKLLHNAKRWNERGLEREQRKGQDTKSGILLSKSNQALREANILREKKIKEAQALLDNFYARRNVSQDVKLEINKLGWIKPHGTELQKTRAKKDRVQKLLEYQSEMRNFADHLKTEFFYPTAIKAEK